MKALSRVLFLCNLQIDLWVWLPVTLVVAAMFARRRRRPVPAPQLLQNAKSVLIPLNADAPPSLVTASVAVIVRAFSEDPTFVHVSLCSLCFALCGV